MPRDLDVKGPCQWVSLRQALGHFALYAGATQSQEHIRPLHWYVACRLVLEGGFHPDEIVPRPPFRVRGARGRPVLAFDPAAGGRGERTILGGLKTKNVDVVVTKEGLGPVVAVSCKGTTKAFRNLTNRMEEAVGDCTNLHITYPAMACGFLAVLRGTRGEEAAVAGVEAGGAPPARQLAANDIAIGGGGDPVTGIIRYHNALREVSGRRGIRDDVSRYEAVALAVVEAAGPDAGLVLDAYPPPDSPLRLEQFFAALYLRYEERFVYAAPDLEHLTRRAEWAPASPFLAGDGTELEYEPRVARDDA